MSRPHSIVFLSILALLVSFALAHAQRYPGDSGGRVILQIYPTGTPPATSVPEVPTDPVSIYVPGRLETNGCWKQQAEETGSSCMCRDKSDGRFFVDYNCNATPDGNDFYLGSGGGGGGGLNDAHLIDPEIRNANSRANAMHVGGSSLHGCKTYVEGGEAIHECTDAAGNTTDTKLAAVAGKTIQFLGDQTLFQVMSDNGTWSYFGAGRLRGQTGWAAGSMIGDGTECEKRDQDEVINGTDTIGLRCNMPGTQADGVITSLPIDLPYGFDPAGGIDLTLKAHIINDVGGGTSHGTIQISCASVGQKPGAWSSHIEMDITTAAVDDIHDVVSSGTVTVPTDSGGVACAAYDMLYWKYTLCDNSSLGTLCQSSGGHEDTLSYAHMRAEFRKNAQ